MSSTTFEFKNLLKIANGIIFILLIFVYDFSHNHPYINEISIFLACALVFQTHVVLSIKRNSTDPFVILLLYYVTVYYSFRIVTLTYFGHSDVFIRFPYNPSDTNYTLLFIIFSNFFMIFGFGISKKKTGQLTAFDRAKINPHPIVMPWIIIIFLSFFSLFFGIHGQIASHSRIAGIFINYFNPSLLFFPCVIYFIVHIEKVFFIIRRKSEYYIVRKRKISKHYFYLLFI